MIAIVTEDESKTCAVDAIVSSVVACISAQKIFYIHPAFGCKSGTTHQHLTRNKNKLKQILQFDSEHCFEIIAITFSASHKLQDKY